ncbi:hypothetical protein GM418_13785 [Maribellus comscasis]|uniref:Uncharacterized protein n=1 Tax=Maribellus comscasis TaxID=2681766 RepID=A0A6I6JUG3_9BACT|nr:hypothetical protein [Maribellus comscasis]QGY44698.1 hypothetical protein GM418_13785 [Maribellus comscasis]
MGIAAGVIIILISIAHNIYGEKKQVPELKKVSNDSVMIGSLRIMIFQGGVLLFAVGIIQVLVSADIIQLPGTSAYFPVGIVLINFITSLIIAGFFHREVFKVTIPQFVVFSIIIALQFLSLF